MKQVAPPNGAEQRGPWSLLPGSIISVCIHVTLLLLASYSLRGCEQSAPAEAGGRAYREIGLAVVPDASSDPSQETATNPQDSEADTASEDEQQAETQDSLPDQAPDISKLLNQDSESTSQNDASADGSSDAPDTVGIGLPAGGLTLSGDGIPELIRPRSKAGVGPAGSLAPGENETSFMNIVGNGQSFVYLIDISSSMGNAGRLELAKSQLKSSLRLLKPSQQFQVLFYNETTMQMKLRNRPAKNMYSATAIHVQLAEDEIDRVTPGSGTEHLNPILHALRLEPDVIYFLTDGDQPRLSRLDLQKIRRNNRSSASIHVIEFASGARESRDLSWLQLLASQSRGKYNYIPIR